MTFQFHIPTLIPSGDWIWVFASDFHGRHNKGNARIARVNFRAEFGKNSGPTHSAYAIPVTAASGKAIPLAELQDHIAAFIEYANDHPEKNFFVTRIGCDRGVFKDDDVGPLFAKAPENCSLPNAWRMYVSQARCATTQSLIAGSPASGSRSGEPLEHESLSGVNAPPLGQITQEQQERARCPFCGHWMLADLIEAPADYCHHEVFNHG